MTKARILLVLTLLAGCASTSTPPTTAPELPEAPSQPSPPTDTPDSSFPSGVVIFGGLNNEVFLGCLSCPAGDPNSVYSEFGTYGSEYSATSIFNNYGQYGSPYSIYSACNPYTQTPPIIVEGSNYYGRLTVNRYHSEASSDPALYEWLTTTVCIE